MSGAGIPLGRRLLLPALIVGVIAISVAEVWLLTAVATRITVLGTLLLLVAEAALGVWLLRREGRKAWRALADAYATGQMPSGRLADAALVLVGGVMLILPGFITDVLGLICLLPWTRPLARWVAGGLIARHAARSGVDLGLIAAKADPGSVVPGETVPDDGPSQGPTTDDPQVIRGEIED